MYEMSTLVPFCRMKISRSSRTTAKKPTETHSPLILVRLILCWGSAWAGAVWAGAAGRGSVCPGAVGPGANGSGLSSPVDVGCGSLVI
jgi:hypothetical protein